MTSTTTPPAKAARLDRRLVAVMAVACGAAVANLYYAQPLLRTIAGAFGISDATAGLLVTVSQVFYAIGLILLVPLGDLVERRRLIARLLTICTVGLVVMAVAPSFALLAGAMAVVATTSVVVQILVPFASTLADESERGNVVGIVMSGLLTGILLARTVSGLLAGAVGWRAMFVVAAGLMAVLGAVLWRVLPRVAPPSSLPYRRLLATVAELVRDEPALRRRMAYGACGFAGFTLVWTTIAFLLSDAPFRFGETTIGLFGLAGLAGAFGAQGLGRVADAGRGRPATGVVLVAILASWGVLALSSSSVVGIVVGLMLIDFGVQGQNVLSQYVIYGIGAEHASRVTTAYVTANFIGGALGSAAGAIAWGGDAWSAVCAVGAAIAGLALVLWLTER